MRKFRETKAGEFMARKPKDEIAASWDRAFEKIRKENLKAESLTVRLHPQVRYGLELLARYQRRTLSSVVDWGLTETLRREMMPAPQGEHPVHEVIKQLWSPYESDRLVRLAIWDSFLLTYEEQLMWKVITEESSFWTMKKPPTATRGLEGKKPYPDLYRIRQCWAEIRLTARGVDVDLTRAIKEDRAGREAHEARAGREAHEARVGKEG